jgi:hypothetical protein
MSTLMLIIKQSDRQFRLHPDRRYKQILLQHRHLLIGPIILIVLALPRLLITFISKCMKSANDPWLYLLGYFISFVPSMLTFILFIVASKFYSKELRKTLTRYRTTIQRRFH